MRNDLHLRQDPKADLQQTMQPTATTQTTVRVAGPRDAAAWSERARAEPQRTPVLHLAPPPRSRVPVSVMGPR